MMETTPITPEISVQLKIQSLDYTIETVNRLIVENLRFDGSSSFTIEKLNEELVIAGLTKIPSEVSPKFVARKFEEYGWDVTCHPGGAEGDPTLSFIPKKI